MSTQESPASLCKLLCELDRLIKEHLFGEAHECGTDCKAVPGPWNAASGRPADSWKPGG